MEYRSTNNQITEVSPGQKVWILEGATIRLFGNGNKCVTACAGFYAQYLRKEGVHHVFITVCDSLVIGPKYITPLSLCPGIIFTVSRFDFSTNL